MNNLKSEQEIMQTWKGDVTKPLVSICCITYNHEPYIRYALEGILIQETNFPYEVLIHDDASTDSTSKIIREYHKEYPNIIKPIYQKENQYSKGIKPNVEFNYPRMKGEYIAYCEGDDFWTNPKKLSKQVEFLQKNPEFIATSHKIQVIDQYNEIINRELDLYNYSSNVYSISDFEDYKLPGQLATIVCRNIWRDLDVKIKEKYYSLNVNGDRKLALLLVLEGKVYCFSEKMSNYRRVTDSGTSWTARNSGINLALNKYLDIIRLEKFAKETYETKLHFKKQRLDCFYSAVIFFVKNPRIENAEVMKKIWRYKYDKSYEFIIYSIVQAFTWPIRKSIRKLKSSGK